MKRLFALPLLTPLAALGCGGFFYEAPPTLDRYPERLSVKTMRELLRENAAPVAQPATFAELEHETRALAGSLTTHPPAELRAGIDATLERNRTGEYRKRFANCLYDLRDLLDDGAAEEAVTGGYLTARLEVMSQDDGFIYRPKVADDDHRTPAEREASRLAVRNEAAEQLARHARAASANLRPHWLVLLGALYFRGGNFEEAARTFTRIIDEAPAHPRAEIARLMLARCRIEQFRDRRGPGQTTTPDEASFQAADEALNAYLATYPQGRFALDVPGWRVDLARERGDLHHAFSLLLEQMDATAHPEIVRRAAREMELLLEQMDERPRTGDRDEADLPLPLEELARRPLAALAVVYHLLDTNSREDFARLINEAGFSDRELVEDQRLPVLRLRESGKTFLPQLAEALAARHSEMAARWQPRYLAILAWAASEAGQQRQAVRCCELAGPALQKSDDLRFARAVALQRANDLPEARAALEELRRDFPHSPLRTEFGFRLATILRDQQEAGLAVAELLRLKDEQKEWVDTFDATEERPVDPAAGTG